MSLSAPENFADTSCTPPVRGLLHRPSHPGGDGIVLAHGAGSDCRSPLLAAIAEAYAVAGFWVLRCDLPFRQSRPHGPPAPGNAALDRAGLENAVQAMRTIGATRIFLGGHSYGGRQATMLCAERPATATGLLLFSYPLHPPTRAEPLRTQHFPSLQTPALFVHGTRDPFGSIEEMERALKSIPARTELIVIAGAGHDLGFKGKAVPGVVVAQVLAASQQMFDVNA